MTASPSPDYNISSVYSPYDNGHQLKHNTPSDKFIIIGMLIFFSVIVFFSSLHMYAKWLWRIRNRNRHFNTPQFQLGAADQHHLQASAAGAGLSKAAIATLPTFTYTARAYMPGVPPTAQPDSPCKDTSTPLLECAVCLSEFQENEKGRMLSACKHSFHIGCIDMWFSSHRTCPLCRTVVMADTVDKDVSPGCIPAGTELPTELVHEDEAVEARSSAEEKPAANEMLISVDMIESTLPPAPVTFSPSPSTAASAAVNTTTNYATGIILSPSSSLQQQASSSTTRHSPARHVPQYITIEIPTRSQDIPVTSLDGGIALPMSTGHGGRLNSLPAGIWAILKKTLWNNMQAASNGKSFITEAGILALPKDAAASRLPLI